MTDDSLDKRLVELRDRLTLEQKVRLLTGQDWWSVPSEPAIGLRSLVVSDGPAGVRGTVWSELSPSASLPCPVALGASWDVATVRAAAWVLAYEARRKGVDVVLGPTINLHRSPYGGRHFECFSEDPLLTGVLGTAYVRGLQDHGVGATAKHYVANDSETDRFTVDVRPAERTLRELYLAPFERLVIDGGAWLVMAAYNSVYGATMSESPLLTYPLKDEWGFDGVVISDWFATRSTERSAQHGLDLVMPGPTGPWGDSLVTAVQATGVSLAAVDDKVLRLLRLAARVGALEGTSPKPVPEPDIDAVLRDIAADGMVLVRNDGVLPLLSAGELPPPGGLPSVGALPSAGELRRVAVVGPLADMQPAHGGGSATVVPDHAVTPLDGLRFALGPDVELVHEAGTRLPGALEPVPAEEILVDWVAADGSVLRHEVRRSSRLRWVGDAMPDAAELRLSVRVDIDTTGVWQFSVAGDGAYEMSIDGTVAKSGSVEHKCTAGTTVDVGLVRHLDPGSTAVTVTFGVVRPRPSAADELANAVAAAAAADVAIVVVGTTGDVESEGFDRDTLALPGEQDALVRAVAAANPRTVVVVNSGAPVLLPWRDDVAAVLLAWFGGQEIGAALADVLLGAREPGGRLPTSWPATEDGVLGTKPVDGVLSYDEGLDIGYRRDQALAYAFGHGLGYTAWLYTDIQATVDDGVIVKVRNVGERRGKEVVQLYLSRPDSSVDRPRRWLAGFAVVAADPGAEATATIELDPRVFRHWDGATHRWATEPGTYFLSAGHSSVDLPLRTEIVVA